MLRRVRGWAVGRRLSRGLATQSTLGMVRESYGMWERRAPLCPEHVAELVGQGFRVKVQPCSRRVFPNEAYREAGAEVVSDLSDCRLVLGVKQVPVEQLLPDRSYMFFSHTIKAQSENMPLLDACLERNIDLFDYECLLEQSAEAANRGKRLVAFGKYAGVVGFIDILQGLGQQLLASGYSTPFINSPQCFMNKSLEEAKARVRSLGQEIATTGLPEGLGPLVFSFVGSGNVIQGAREMFDCLPHRMVEPEELEELVKSGGGDEAKHMLYGTLVQQHHLVRRTSDHGFDKAEYYEHPDRYEPVFHDSVAPYTSVLVNGIYWDQRFPRLMTSNQLQDLAKKQSATEHGLRLRAVADITCDIDGSVEMLTRATGMSTPFYEWNALEGRESASIGEADAGVVMLGVDILPTALPREASKHFGDALLPLLPPLLGEGSLPLELENARIAARGKLEPNFKYIDRLRSMLGAPEAESYSGPWKKLFFTGHLFDSGFINHVFDVIEKRGGDFEVGDIVVVPNSEDYRRVSQIVVSIRAPTPEVLEDIDRRLHSLAEVMETAEAVIEQLPHSSNSSNAVSRPTFSSPSSSMSLSEGPGGSRGVATVADAPRKVVLLGAGLVAAPLVEYLTDSSRSGSSKRQVTIVSHLPDEAAALARRAPVGSTTTATLSATSEADSQALAELVRDGDVVVSLLPPPLHAGVAEHCIEEGTHLVTASYVSDAMRGLDKAAKERGVVLLNEMGLDPGMDHMSAMKVIDEAKAKGGKVTSFRSLCGGLCSPDSLDPEDPLQYKFSWSPAGVFAAALSPARFLEGGMVVEQDGATKLDQARPFDGWKSLNLESIPNRDSLIYGDLYGIEDSAQTILRGTLRFRGWCSLVHSFHALGLLDSSTVVDGGSTWGELLDKLAMQQGYRSARAHLETKVGTTEAANAFSALAWLGAGPADLVEGTAGQPVMPLDSFVNVLASKLSLQPEDKDLVLMQHDFEFLWPDGSASGLRSSFIATGDEQHTAMASTVGVTAAIGVDLVLDGTLNNRPGVVAPMTPDIYEPSLRLLEAQGYIFTEDPYNPTDSM